MKRILKWLAIAVVVLIVGAIALLWTPDTDAAAMRTKYGAPPSQFVDLGGGLSVHVRDEGPRDAPAIVLLHGSNADLHTWDAWAARLAKTHRVIRYDQIGHGLTGPSPSRDYATAAFVTLVDRVTSRLGVERFVLAGNSMGGGIAWRYAVARPGRLDGLILVDASGAPDMRKQSLPIGFRIAKTPGVRDIMKAVTPRSMIAASLRQSVSNQATVTDATIDRYWELLRYPGNRQATIDRFGTPRIPTNVADLARINVPTLVIWGAEDKLLPVSGAKFFTDHIRGSRSIIYPRTGHIPMEEVADRSANDVLAWLAELPRAR